MTHNFYPGDIVQYKDELGKVVKTNDNYVFVEYYGSLGTAKATRAEDLIMINDNIHESYDS